MHPVHGAEIHAEQDVTPYVTKRLMTRWGVIKPSESGLLSSLLIASLKDKESWVWFESDKGKIGIEATPEKFRRIFSAIALPETQEDGHEPAHTYIPGVFVHLRNK